MLCGSVRASVSWLCVCLSVCLGVVYGAENGQKHGLKIRVSLPHGLQFLAVVTLSLTHKTK